MLLLLLGVAAADDVIVVLRESGSAFNGAFPRVTITDAAGVAVAVDPQDGGAPPDQEAGDAVYAGAGRNLGAGPYQIKITDGGDMRVWTGEVEAVGVPPAVLVDLAPGGVLTALGAGALPYREAVEGSEGDGGAPSDGGQGGQPSSAPAAPGAPGGAGQKGGGAPERASTSSRVDVALTPTPARAMAWLALVVAAGWVLAGSRRFTAAAIEPLDGDSPPLRPGLAEADGDPVLTVRRLAGPCRVLLVGALDPGPIPAGTVFSLGPDLVAVDDVVAVVRELHGKGPPVVVLVVGDVVADRGRAGLEALRTLSAALPAVDIRAFPAKVATSSGGSPA